VGEGGQRGSITKHLLFWGREACLGFYVAEVPHLPPPSPYSKNIGGGPIKWLHVKKNKLPPFPLTSFRLGVLFHASKEGIIWMMDEIYCNFHSNMDKG
jgi:hypothetical protein